MQLKWILAIFAALAAIFVGQVASESHDFNFSVCAETKLPCFKCCADNQLEVHEELSSANMACVCYKSR